MILNEHVDEFFKELNIGLDNPSSPIYNSLDHPVTNPYNNDTSNILDFNIKNDITGKDSATLSGVVDYTHSQFVIKKLLIDANSEDPVDLIKRLLNSVIVNLEQQQISIGLIFWRLNKAYKNEFSAALKAGFTIEATSSDNFDLAYYLASNNRQSLNTIKTLDIAHRMAINSGFRSV